MKIWCICRPPALRISIATGSTSLMSKPPAGAQGFVRCGSSCTGGVPPNPVHLLLEGHIVNAYNQFTLPQLRGSGQHVSADGMRWDVYEQNLLAEYHLRYGAWGGVGYYHVSEKYIALFSRFIPCGVWEGTYILDGLVNNAADLQPDIVHADTQGQSTAIFGLAHLLGIKLMPRIRNWKDLTLFRPSPQARYQHIDALFAEPVKWRLIETLLPDLLRVGMSIKAGRLTPSTLGQTHLKQTK